MANKRRIVIDLKDEGPEGSAEKPAAEWPPVESMTDRELSLKAGWKDWFLRVYLKYFFVLGAFFIVYMVPAEALRSMNKDISMALAFISVLIIVPLAIWGYWRLWGYSGRWGKENPPE
jgi:hypothetical protein